MSESSYEKFECEICGSVCLKKNTRKQKGLRRCPECVDDIKEIKPVNVKWDSPRSDSDTTTAVTTLTTYTITAAGGITPSQSIPDAQTRSASLGLAGLPDNIFFGASYYMLVYGSGGAAIDVTASPQIVVGNNGDALVLEGTSDDGSIQLDNGTGIDLKTSKFILGDEDRIVLVYDDGDSVWREVSRYVESDYV